MSHRRVSVPLPHVANAIPRGARKPREICFRTEATVEIRFASPSELGLAVVVGDELSIGGNSRRYIGFDGALWLPVEVEVGRPIGHAEAIDAITTGSRKVGRMQNPFLEIGQTSEAAFFHQSHSIEEMALRTVLADDRDDRIARATRVASDLLLIEGDRVLRRSVGPFWRTGSNVRPFPVHPEFDLPGSEAVYFGIARHREALEFAEMEWGVGQAPDRVEIRMPECVPDHDALVAARAVAANFDAIQAMNEIAKRMPDEAGLLDTLQAAGSLYGRRFTELARGLRGYRACPGMPPVAPTQVVAATERVRDFFGAPLDAPDPKVREYHARSRELFERSVGMHIGRFDVCERDRLPVVKEAPDLDAFRPETTP